MTAILGVTRRVHDASSSVSAPRRRRGLYEGEKRVSWADISLLMNVDEYVQCGKRK